MLLFILALVFASVALASFVAIDAALAFAAARCSRRRVGGLTFVRVGRLSLSYCLTRR